MRASTTVNIKIAFHAADSMGTVRDWNMGRTRKRTSAENGGLRPKVNIGASAKLAATAKYEVKKTVQEVIPEDVTRAKATAWLTIISPITQWAALKADELAHKRKLLRLQQEETLTVIAARADARIKEIGSKKSVPIKFLVPFLEKASLEEPDSELVDLWANLLVSAAEDYSPHFIHFANIVSQMSGRQAQTFTDVIGTNEADALERAMETTDFYLHNFMQKRLSDVFKERSPKPRTENAMWEFMDEVLDLVGIEIKHLQVEDTNSEEFGTGLISTSKYRDELETDFAILTAIGLIEYGDTGIFNLSKRWQVKVLYYYVTKLGREFAKACGITK